VTVGCRAAVLALFALLVAGSAAHAQGNPTAADDAFKKGRELYKANQFAEACEQFELSQKLDPANGTLFNIGQCSERIGKLATAAAAYREVVANDTNEQRKASAGERLKAITPRIPKLLVTVDKPPPGIVVEIASKAGPRGVAANTPVEVDFGDYSVVVRARGYSEFMSRVKVSQEAKTTSVTALLKPGASNSETIGVAKRPNDSDAPHSKRKLYGIGAMATGGGVLVGGIVVGVLARNRWADAQDVCDGTCTTQADVDRANELGDQARSKATLSTVLVLGGAAIAGVGAYLFVTAPGETRISPTASDSGAGVTISGVF
jgi:hypothetical protein